MPLTDKIFVVIEKVILIFIALFTVTAIYQGVVHIVSIGVVKLGDLLLLFLYLEVFGMLALFYKDHKIPIAIPIYIAITALCRVMILDGKPLDPIELIAHAGAILLLGLAIFLINKSQEKKTID
jgi:protein PsiE